ncbi:MAG: multicopper oxidase domain-containing protein, partial [Bacteroidota bacterium]
VDDLRELPIILSEWTDKNPKNINRMLHYANDWSSIKKGSVQSYGEAIAAHHFTTKFRNEWKRMMAMDVSDVYYDKFLMNGSTNKKFDQFKPGEKVRLRISNGGASSYFWLKYSGGKITVVANDGNDVVPVEVDRLIIGVSETYDIVIQIPDTGMSYELLATPEDRTKSSSMFFGDGPVYLATRMPRLDYFEGMKMMNDMMTINGNMKDMGMDMSVQKMNMSNVMYPELNESTETVSKHQHEKSVKDDSSMGDMDMEMGAETSIVTLNYSMLKSFQNTTLPSDATVKELHFELTGNMRRYVWSMDNRILDEVDKIKIKKGENVRIILYNNSMMRHPMHLHGHDFRLLNGQGINAPLMNVLDILPMETDTIEFEANLKGDWFFHCHILYHMMAGMNRVFSYENQDSNPYLPNKKWAYKKLQNESNPIHFTVSNDFASNGNDGQMLLQNTRWSFGTEWRLGYNDKNGYETETHVGRYIGKNQFLMPFVGFDWRYRKFGIDEQERNLFGQTNTKDSRSLFSVGFNYTLPMLIVFQVEVFHDGSTRMQLLRNDIPISKRMRMAFMVNTDKEYMAGLKYILNKNIAISTHYDSDMGFGAGMTLTY